MSPDDGALIGFSSCYPQNAGAILNITSKLHVLLKQSVRTNIKINNEREGYEIKFHIFFSCFIFLGSLIFSIVYNSEKSYRYIHAKGSACICTYIHTSYILSCGSISDFVSPSLSIPSVQTIIFFCERRHPSSLLFHERRIVHATNVKKPYVLSILHETREFWHSRHSRKRLTKMGAPSHENPSYTMRSLFFKASSKSDRILRTRRKRIMRYFYLLI